MPYLNMGVRGSIDSGRKPKTPGELNYAMSQLIKSYIAMKGENYTAYNDIVGAMECLKMEVYRRLTGPYEDKKLLESADVFQILRLVLGNAYNEGTTLKMDEYRNFTRFECEVIFLLEKILKELQHPGECDE